MKCKSPQILSLVQYVSAGLLLAFTLAPFAWMVLTSLSHHRDLTAIPLKWIPPSLTFQRYWDIFTHSNNDIACAFQRAMLNSLTVSGAVTLMALILGLPASYAFARLRFRFKGPLMYLILFTFMVPPIVLVIPLYLLVSSLGLLDCKVTLMALYLSMVLPFVLWMMQGYFSALSKSYEESAAMDGCSRLQILWHVYLPLARPGVIATAILAFLIAWDEFFLALIFTSTLEAKTLSVAIAEFSGKHYVDYAMIATGGVIASLPPILIALCFQKYIAMGLAAGGIKE